MKPQNLKQTQLEKANALLVALKSDVTAQDRHAAFELFSEPTVIRYLKGEGKDLDTAIALLELFKGRIEKREELIRA